MPKPSPIRWRGLVGRRHTLGFEGPYYGGKHPYMAKGDLVLTIPNPHRDEIGADLMSRLLRQAGISRQEWESAK